MFLNIRQLETLAGKVEEYEQLLEDLSLRVEGEDQYMIRRALDQVRFNGSSTPIADTNLGTVLQRRRSVGRGQTSGEGESVSRKSWRRKSISPCRLYRVPRPH